MNDFEDEGRFRVIKRQDGEEQVLGCDWFTREGADSFARTLVSQPAESATYDVVEVVTRHRKVGRH